MDLEIILSIIAILFLLVLSGLFSGSETALTAASRARMHHLARKGNKRARIVNGLIKARERLIGAILLGNNLVNILASALATSVLISLFGELGVAYATVIMTFLVLIFAEVLPKTLALKRTDRMALAMAPLIRLVVLVLSPVVRLVQMIVNLVLRLFGITHGSEVGLVDATDEIRGTLALQQETGGIVKHDRDMLDSILDLKEVDVSEIMVHRRNMVMIGMDAGNEQIVAEMLASPFTRVPLWQEDSDNIIGVLHAKDLLRALNSVGGDVEQLDLEAVIRPPWFVPETTDLQEQLSAFRERREHFALVVDEYGAIMGLVTLEDILEEIVGDISDEHDLEGSEDVRQRGDGAFIVDGAVTVRDLNRLRDWELPEDTAATVAGLVIEEAKKIPEVGEGYMIEGFRMEVLRRQRNRILSVLIYPPNT